MGQLISPAKEVSCWGTGNPVFKRYLLQQTERIKSYDDHHRHYQAEQDPGFQEPVLAAGAYRFVYPQVLSVCFQRGDFALYGIVEGVDHLVISESEFLGRQMVY